MDTIKVSELAYVRLRLPDLDEAERFLTDFGLIVSVREEERLYLRGSDPDHHCYIVEQGERRLLGFAFWAKSEDDLRTLAAAEGTIVSDLTDPGGGKVVRLVEPNGYTVEIVHGIAKPEPIRVERQPVNTAATPLARAGKALRLPNDEPTPVKRLAHVVLGSPKVIETMSWFADHLGMITSDEVFDEIGGSQIGAFMRVDKGEEHVDHHAFYVMRAPHSGLQHISFEAQDIDAVLSDHHYLLRHGHDHAWGIGRHLLGSQLFDYWYAPFGYLHEHWADTDRFSAETPTEAWAAKDGLRTQFGDRPSDRFRQNVIP